MSFQFKLHILEISLSTYSQFIVTFPLSLISCLSIFWFSCASPSCKDPSEYIDMRTLRSQYMTHNLWENTYLPPPAVCRLNPITTFTKPCLDYVDNACLNCASGVWSPALIHLNDQCRAALIIIASTKHTGKWTSTTVFISSWNTFPIRNGTLAKNAKTPFWNLSLCRRLYTKDEMQYPNNILKPSIVFRPDPRPQMNGLKSMGLSAMDERISTIWSHISLWGYSLAGNVPIPYFHFFLNSSGSQWQITQPFQLRLCLVYTNICHLTCNCLHANTTYYWECCRWVGIAMSDSTHW